MRVRLSPFFQTNYLFTLSSETGDHAGPVFVDPGDASTAREALKHAGAERPSAILLTHHHPDHVGGVAALIEHEGVDTIYGSAEDAWRLPSLTNEVRDGDCFMLLGEPVCVLSLPGHTTGLVAYYMPESKALFCGDALFGMGCGRMFEGTPETFYASMQKIKSLPADTLVYCAHEYTQDNAEFCLAEFPEDPLYREEPERLKAFRSSGLFTVPLTLGEELERNPFLRCDSPGEFGRLRALRDRFVPSRHLPTS